MGELSQSSRADELAARYTAAELAAMLAASEGLVHDYRGRLTRARRALHGIARGEWTAAGARNAAHEALSDE
jgi:hypothetical protein